MDSIEEIVASIGGHAKVAFHSANCCWWTTFPGDCGSYKGELACPHCDSPILQTPFNEFVADAKEFGIFGLNIFIFAHSRKSDTCHRTWNKYAFDLWRANYFGVRRHI